MLLYVPLKFATRRKNSFFFFPQKKTEIIFLRKIGLGLLGVPRSHTNRLLSRNSALAVTSISMTPKEPGRELRGGTRGPSAQEHRRRRRNPAGLGLGQTEQCDLTLSSGEAANPRHNSGLETEAAVGKGYNL